MGIEGLDLILNKQEVVPTVSANDLLQYAERVETDYRRHVRTYVPLSRAAEGQEGQLNVDEFVRRTIKGVKDAKALRGHLTAEFGYGKTTTALYLWQKAEQANLLVVPPFQMLQLPDLITATHGWIRYRLATNHPELLASLDSLFQEVTGRSLEREAKTRNIPLTALNELFAQGRLVLELQANEYVNYFERVTALVLSAGYEGLLVIPDEIQQYVEPRIRRNDDPIVPFFNLVQAIYTRAGYLKFGIIIVVPRKELGVIREVRKDVIARMNDVWLDLTTVYDIEFAPRLWQQFAAEYNFREQADLIIAPTALAALGEMAARNDLSDGPRTVVNVFRRVVERYKTYGSKAAAYTPIDLIDDMLGGAIQFSGNSEIQNTTRRALQNAIVHRQPERYERAIKLAAAFPTTGVPLETQREYGVYSALEELRQQALGELVISVGPVDLYGVTLFGLQVGLKATDWLTTTIRDFRRIYAEHHTTTKDRILRTFTTLLRTRIFNNWSVVDEQFATLASNHSILLEGEYSSFATKFPKRRVHVRIFWENEELKDAENQGDVTIEFYLSMHTQLRDQPNERRRLVGTIEVNHSEHTTRVPINLLYVRPEGIPHQIQERLQNVWSPYDLSPAVLMNIHAMLEEKRAESQIPRADDSWIASGFQPDLLDTILRDLFNAEVGAKYGGVAQGRIVEAAVSELLTQRYGDSYITVIGAANWRNSLQRYANALKQLENLYQKRGEVDVEGTKKEIAELFVFSNSTLDNFIKIFPSLLSVTRDWRGNEPGAVRFSLHDLESKILRWLHESSKTERVKVGSKTVDVHIVDAKEIYQRSVKLGYRSEEIEQLMELLVARGMAEVVQSPFTHLLREVASPTIDLDDLSYQLKDFQQDLTALLAGFAGNVHLTDLQSQAAKWQQFLEMQRKSETPDGKPILQVANTIRVRHNELKNFVDDKRSEITRRLNSLRQGIRPLNPQYLQELDKPIVGSVSYVDQINALRRAFALETIKTKALLDTLITRLEKFTTDLQQPTLSISTLANSAQELNRLEDESGDVIKKVDQFETNYRHLNGWKQLVSGGSELSNDLNQMVGLASAEFAEFENLGREISGHISSASNKLGVLPDHAAYLPLLQSVRDKVRKIRQDAAEHFLNLQQRYQKAFTSRELYRPEQVSRSVVYNISNPDDSYRQVYEAVQTLCENLRQQMKNRLREYADEAQNILATPLIQTLAQEDKDRVQQDGTAIVLKADQGLRDLGALEIDNLSRIQDFPPDGGGAFEEIITALRAGLDCASELHRNIRALSSWLTTMELTSEESLMMQRLSLENPDGMVDLVEWQKTAKFNDVEFWKTLRSLYQKRRVRLTVGRVRGQ